MKETSPQNEQNPFELVESNGVLVPEVLTHLGREDDLNEYKKGWNDQSKNPVELVTRNTNNWYGVGATKRHQQFSDTLTTGTSTEDHQKDLFQVMEAMRSNPDLIPHDAWRMGNDDEDGAETPARFS